MTTIAPDANYAFRDDLPQIEIDQLKPLLSKLLGIDLEGFEILYENDATGSLWPMTKCSVDSKERRVVLC